MITSWRNEYSTPPTAAIPADRAKAYTFTPGTLIPRAAAARSLVRTASRRRPVRPRRTFDTIIAIRAKNTMETAA